MIETLSSTICAHAAEGTSRRHHRFSHNGLSFLPVALLLLAALVQSGCVGMTSAKSVDAGQAMPSIASQPHSQTVKIGQTATFAIAVAGTGPFTYQWKKNGAVIPGGVSPSYTTPVVSLADNKAQFAVTIAGADGTVTSDAAQLTVDGNAASITMQPVSQSVTVGQTATFSVAAAGTAPITYQWQKRGVVIAGATSPSYTTGAAVAGDNGATFAVVVSNAAGTATSNAATLSVTAVPVTPSISSQPASITLTAGQTASFSVVAAGTAPLAYQWRRNGTPIGGATSATYTMPGAVTTTDSGAIFSVAVSNSVGNLLSNSATLTVNPAATAPSITAQPTNRSVTTGQFASFSVTAAGTGPLSYQWRKSGVAISGATSSSYTTPATTTADSGSTFSVVVSNAAGNATSASATLTVTAGTTAPSITTQPANRSVTAGQTAAFSVVAGGTSPFTYQWRKNGAAISGATAASYTSPVTALADDGAMFSVVVTNSAGSVTSANATLDVTSSTTAPSITTQPANRSVTVGQTAAFSVVAGGTSPFTYQWRKNGAAISGATAASYTTPATAVADDGATFSVVVTNSAGSATSANATLDVTTAGLLTTSSSSLNFGNVTTSSSNALQATISNTGGSSVTISNVTISGAGITTSGISSGQILNANSSATLHVTFAPSSAATLSGSVTIASNASNASLSISLVGAGVAPVAHSAALSWTASTSTVSGYNVYRGAVSGGPYTLLTSSPTSGLGYTDTTVKAGQTYYYVVTSVDSSGNESTTSNQATASIPTP